MTKADTDRQVPKMANRIVMKMENTNMIVMKMANTNRIVKKMENTDRIVMKMTLTGRIVMKMAITGRIVMKMTITGGKVMNMANVGQKELQRIKKFFLYTYCIYTVLQNSQICIAKSGGDSKVCYFKKKLQNSKISI